MRAMILEKPGEALQYRHVPDPIPLSGQVLVKVAACGVCRTDLHVVDGDLTDPELPIIPGHEIVGRVEAIGSNVGGFRIGDRVGIPWLGHTCGQCFFCKTNRENLCDAPRFTGYQINGGYAEYTVAEAAYCFAIPESYADAAAAPLLCAGLIGHRALRMAGDAVNLGILWIRRGSSHRCAGRALRAPLGLRLHPTGGYAGTSFRNSVRLCLDGRFRSAPSGRYGRGHYLCTGGRPGAGRAEGCAKGWHGCARWHPYERNSRHALPVALGRTNRALSGKSDPPRCCGLSRTRRAHVHPYRNRAVRLERRQRRLGPASGRSAYGGRRAGAGCDDGCLDCVAIRVANAVRDPPMREECRHRHVFNDFTSGATKHNLTHARVAIGAHGRDICARSARREVVSSPMPPGLRSIKNSPTGEGFADNLWIGAIVMPS